MITYTKEEFIAAWGPEGVRKLVEALTKCNTAERKTELIRNHTVNVIYKDYITVVVVKGVIHLAITAEWWYEKKGGRVRARITTVEFFDSREEMEEAQRRSKAQSIKLNQN